MAKLKNKGGRPKGKKSGYTMSGGALAQRHSATITRRREGKDDTGKLSILDELCGGDEELMDVYRRAATDSLQAPLMFLSRKVAELEVALVQQRRKDAATEDDKVFISPEMIKATDLVFKAVKVQEQARSRQDKSRGRRFQGKDVIEAEVIEANFEDIIGEE